MMSQNLSIIQKPSPHFDQRLIGQPTMIVLHQFKQMPKLSGNFSIHYFINKNGSIDQFIHEQHRAWNAGKSYWHSRYLIDDWSISIGLEESSKENREEVTAALISLIRNIRSRHNKILNTSIVSCYDITVEREKLTIPDIPWFAMARAGIGIMPQEGFVPVDIPLDAGQTILNAHTFLKKIGYYITSQTSSAATPAFKSVLKAFQVHFLHDHQRGDIDLPTYAMLRHVQDLYVNEYKKEWQNRKKKSNKRSNIGINTSFRAHNFNKRLLGPPFMIVIHDTEGTFEHSLQILTGSKREVSAHYLIDLFGSIYQLVEDKYRAWHAGISYWHGFKDLNDISIGIELVNRDSAKNGYPNEQMAALINLLIDIRSRYNIPLHFIVSHEDVAPTRKSDPGKHFPWQKLVESGMNIGVTEQDPDENQTVLSHSDYVTNIRRMLKQIGYLIEPQESSIIDEELSDSLRMFQWRFAPDHPNWNLGEVDMVAYKKLAIVANTYVKSYADD